MCAETERMGEQHVLLTCSIVSAEGCALPRCSTAAAAAAAAFAAAAAVASWLMGALPALPGPAQ